MLLTCGYLFLDNIHEFEEHFELYSTMKVKANVKKSLLQYPKKETSVLNMQTSAKATIWTTTVPELAFKKCKFHFSV